MQSVSCNSKHLILVFVLVLCVALTKQMLEMFPFLLLLFTEHTNFLLLVLLCLFVLFLDIPSGIIISFIVIYIGIYISSSKVLMKKNTVSSNVASSMNLTPTSTTLQQSIECHDNNVNNVNTRALSNAKLLNTEYLSESEIVYDKKYPMANGNIQPFQVLSGSDIKPMEKPCNSPDFITRVESPERSGYDVAGCRYDFKNSPQNLTRNGPPLAQCGTYNNNASTCSGTIFYPLNE